MSGPMALMEAWLKGEIDAAPVLDFAHYENHEGNTYHNDGFVPALADDALIVMGLHCGSKSAHIQFTASVGGDGLGRLYEAPTFTASGTMVTPRNKNRTVSKVATLTPYSTPTVSVSGTYLQSNFIPGGTRNQASGGSGGTRSEWILKPNTWYLAMLQNISGGAQPFGMQAEWYEHTIKLPSEAGFV